MFSYYLRLASKSFRRTPGLTTLMVCAIAFGIGACIVTLTVYHAMSGNPIWWKSNVLYAVTMDSWDPSQPADAERPTLPPPQLTYRDATYLMTSSIPKRKAIMTQLLGMLSGAPGQKAPIPVITRATGGDFFPMFDIPFEYGGGWDAAADQGPRPVIVLSQATTTSSSAAPTASASPLSGTEGSSGSWGCSRAGSRRRSSTTSTRVPSPL